MKENIDKNKVMMSIAIGTICFLIVFMLCIQLKTINKIDVDELEAMREDELRTLLAEWKEKYNETNEELENINSKIDEYNNKLESDEESGELLKQDLESAELLAGLTNVEGTGIIITITDNNEEKITSTDLLDLINELSFAGAEAISIDDQRIVATTDIVDVNEFIVVNGQRITSPYTIKAIGDVTYLQSALNIKGGYIDTYKTNGYTISLKSEDNVVINKYNGSIEMNYAK